MLLLKLKNLDVVIKSKEDKIIKGKIIKIEELKFKTLNITLDGNSIWEGGGVSKEIFTKLNINKYFIEKRVFDFFL